MISQNGKIYLDYAATTPVNPQVIEAMLPFFNDFFGNPSSIHTFGQNSETAIDHARDLIAECLNCISSEVILTSCGSESDNLAIRGAALFQKFKNNSNHILTTPVEHPAVLNTVHQLKKYYGFEVEYLPVDRFGIIKLDELKNRIKPTTALVTAIYGNNEIGSVNPIRKIGEICHAAGVLFHTDAVQAGATLPLDVDFLNVDMLSLGAHKFYGPKGIGLLYKRSSCEIIPQQTGGRQEFGLRAGTHNVPYIVGLAKALQIVTIEKSNIVEKCTKLRNKIINGVLSQIPGSLLTGHPEQRLPNHASFVFEDIESNALLMVLDNLGFACSAGSACKTGNPTPSEVLVALDLPHRLALGSLRVTISHQTSSTDIDNFLTTLKDSVYRLRNNLSKNIL